MEGVYPQPKSHFQFPTGYSKFLGTGFTDKIVVIKCMLAASFEKLSLLEPNNAAHDVTSLSMIGGQLDVKDKRPEKERQTHMMRVSHTGFQLLCFHGIKY
jgi:hypothetical protein